MQGNWLGGESGDGVTNLDVVGNALKVKETVSAGGGRSGLHTEPVSNVI